MKTLLTTLILIALPWTVSAECKYDSTYDYTSFGGVAIPGYHVRKGHELHVDVGHTIGDNIWDERFDNDPMILQFRALSVEPTHDTTREYIVEIKEVCDTTIIHETFRRFEKLDKTKSMHDDCVCECERVTCHTDTIWADKIQVWLTPWQMRVLMEYLERPRDTLNWEYHYYKDKRRR